MRIFFTDSRRLRRSSRRPLPAVGPRASLLRRTRTPRLSASAGRTRSADKNQKVLTDASTSCEKQAMTPAWPLLGYSPTVTCPSSTLAMLHMRSKAARPLTPPAAPTRGASELRPEPRAKWHIYGTTQLETAHNNHQRRTQNPLKHRGFEALYCRPI